MIINMCPSRESPDFEIIMHDNGTNIEIGYGIKKTFLSEAKVKHLENFYGLMSVSFKISFHFFVFKFMFLTNTLHRITRLNVLIN